MSKDMPVQLPPPGAPYATFVAAAERLSAIPLSPDQIERGYKVHVAAAHEGKPMEALVAFASAEGLASPEWAALAIVARAYQVADALSDGMDLKVDAPDAYEDIMTGPLYPSDLGYFPVVDDVAA